MSGKQRPKYSVTDYLDIEEIANIKHEYFKGDIFAMTGASINHNRIREAVSQSLANQLMDKDCEVLGSDARIKTTSGLYTYPDLMVICGDLMVENIHGKETILNPLLIIEILSKTTSDYDKNAKFELYKSISSFREYILIDQYRPAVTVYYKQPDDQWSITAESNNLKDVIKLATIECSLALEHIYRRVKFI